MLVLLRATKSMDSWLCESSFHTPLSYSGISGVSPPDPPGGLIGNGTQLIGNGTQYRVPSFGSFRHPMTLRDPEGLQTRTSHS